MTAVNKKGRYGEFGGQFVAETLMPSLIELERTYKKYKHDAAFKKTLRHYSESYGGRPTPLYFAQRLTEHAGGAKIYLKREDLVHGGAHKFNNAMGQALLAKFMGKTRLIAETGAGQHGVATAISGAVLGIPTEVYMGTVDMERQKLNVFRMELLGARVIPVESGSKTLKDATNEALRDWSATAETTHYVIGSVVGPHPYPMMVRDFQSVIGIEAKRQIVKAEGRLPDALVACVGGGSNAMGLFYPFINDADVRLIGVEAGGEGLATGRHAASLCAGTQGVLHGALSYLLQDDDGQIRETESVSAGLDYPGVGPEHAALKDRGRAEYSAATDAEALDAFTSLAQFEGIIPALESSHAIAHALTLAKTMDRDQIIIVNLSGRGDKDVHTVADRLGVRL